MGSFKRTVSRFYQLKAYHCLTAHWATSALLEDTTRSSLQLVSVPNTDAGTSLQGVPPVEVQHIILLFFLVNHTRV